MALGNYTPDQIAEMRARRILLDEKISKPSRINDKSITNLNDALLGAFIQGINTATWLCPPVKTELRSERLSPTTRESPFSLGLNTAKIRD